MADGNQQTSSQDTAGARVPDDYLSAIIQTQTDIAAADLKLETVMQVIVDRTRAITGADGALIEILEGEESVSRAASGFAEHCLGKRSFVRNSSTGAALREGIVQYCSDCTTDPRVDRERCEQAGILSLVTVPLLHAGRRLGALKVLSKKRDAFARHLSAMRLMAGLLATALDNASEFAVKQQLLAERTAAFEALRQNEERFRGAIENAAIGMAIVGTDGSWLKVNRALCEIVGYSEAELLATNFQAITHPDDLDGDLFLVNRLLAGESQSYQLAKRYFHKHGNIVWIMLAVSVVRNAQGEALYFISQIQDITARKKAEWLEADQRAVLEGIARDHPLAEVMLNLCHLIERQAADTWATVLAIGDGGINVHAPTMPPACLEPLRRRAISVASDLSREMGDSLVVRDVVDDPMWDSASVRPAISPKTCWGLSVKAADGTELGLVVAYCSAHRSPSPAEAQVLHTAAQLASVAVEHHETTRKLAHLIAHDPLTGLANRVLFEDRLNQAIALARRGGRSLALFAMDIDRFKSINDTMGHQAGDSLLQQFAHRIRAATRETDTFARVGGDEFMLILPEISGPSDALDVAAKMTLALQNPFDLGGRSLIVTSSMGISVFPDHAADAHELIKAADDAMYDTKRGGRNGFTLFSEAA